MYVALSQETVSVLLKDCHDFLITNTLDSAEIAID